MWRRREGVKTALRNASFPLSNETGTFQSCPIPRCPLLEGRIFQWEVCIMVEFLVLFRLCQVPNHSRMMPPGRQEWLGIPSPLAIKMKDYTAEQGERPPFLTHHD